MAGTRTSNAELWQSAFASSSWWKTLPEPLRAEVASRLVLRKFAAGETIHAQSEGPDGLLGIVSGTLHTIGRAADGDEVLLSVLRQGDWTGFVGVVDGRPHSFDTVAATDLEGAVLPFADAQEIFQADAESLRRIALPLLQILRFGYRFLTETNRRTPRRVIAQRLMDLSHCVYAPGSAPRESLDSVSQDDLAAATYLTRPTVNRVLQRLARERCIQLGYGRITILDIPGLFAAANGPAVAGASTPKAERWTRLLAKQEKPVSSERVREIAMAGPWFANLPSEMREAILPELSIHRYNAGEAIYVADQPSEGIHLLLSGQLRTIAQGRDGVRTLLTLVHPGEWSGFIPSVDGGNQPLTGIATRASTVALLPASALDAIFGTTADHYRYLVQPIVIALRTVYTYVVEFNGLPPQQLVARRLYDLARVPWLDGNYPREFLDNLSQTDIAEATGLSRPSVNKVLGELVRRGLIETGYGRLRIVDPDGLLACSRENGR